MSDDRVVVSADRLTVACPECDAGDVRKRGTAASEGATLRCQVCGEFFDEAIVRPSRPCSGGQPKYADVTLEDVDL